MNPRQHFILWLAQGGGLGRLHPGPGTWGTLGGVVWTALLLLPHQPWFFVVGTLAGLSASVWLCGAAEQLLQQRDPGCVVLDEIAAFPLCFTTWIWIFVRQHGTWPGAADLLGWPTLAAFGLFRVFDIWKPWPIRPSQELPGGWGVTVDDVLAALAASAGLGLGLYATIRQAGP